MLTLAAWHWLALASVVFAGLLSFILKIGAERRYSGAVLNGIAALVSLLITLAVGWWLGERVTVFVMLMAVANGGLFVYGTLARSDALSAIDAAIFFPIYKIVGPALVLAAGIIVFGERLTLMQSVGFVLALSVPLLLIDRVEHSRQRDLKRGVWLAIVAAVCISVGQIFSKMVMATGSGPYLYSAAAYAMTVAGIGIPFAYRHGTEVIRASRWQDIVWLGTLAGIFQCLGFITLLYAFQSGPVSTTYAINSTYILIPIILSIWYYGEHWNARKVIAIALSIGAVVLLK
jgi:drug/metabolite transporter (DMT)-like permease